MEAEIQQEEEEEACQEGHVQSKVYFGYGRAAGWALVAVLAVSFVLMQVKPAAPRVHAFATWSCSCTANKLHSIGLLLSAVVLSWTWDLLLIEVHQNLLEGCSVHWEEEMSCTQSGALTL